MKDQSEPNGTTLDAYWRRKNRELDFIRSHLDAAGEGAIVHDPAAFFREVATLRTQLRVQQTAITAHLSETSLDQFGEYELPFGSFSYSYQRYDLSRTGLDWLATLYGAHDDTRAALGLFAGSGMGAVAAILAVIGKLGHRTISISPMAYFETHLLCSRFFPHIELTTTTADLASEADVIWLDTCSTEWSPVADDAGRTRLMVVDTSAVDASDPAIAGWLEDGRRIGCPVLLVRSHTKLDSFGLELARLGSVVVVAPDASEEGISSLAVDLRAARSGLGVGFEMAHVYPWLGNSESLELSRLRTAGIRASTSLLADALEGARRKGDRFEVIRTPHQMYFLVRTGLGFADQAEATAARLSHAIAGSSQREGLAAFAGSSFGLDRCVFIDFVNIHDDIHYLRVAGADLPAAWVAPIGVHIRDAIAAQVTTP